MARHHVVRLASWAFLVVAAALAGIFIVQVATFEATAPKRTEAPGQQPINDRVVVSAPKITGFDRDEQRYEIGAAAAVQDASQGGRVSLESVVGTLRRRSGEILNLAARTALYDPEAKALDLDGAVKLRSAERFLAEMKRARVLLDEKRFRSEERVEVTFSRGVITAGGMEITEDGKRVVFFNGARAIFRPSSLRGDMQP